MRTTLFFDGKCPWCRRGVRALAWLDWLGRLDIADMTKRSDAELPIPRSDAMRGMPVRTSSGKGLCGWPAIRAALMETPAGLVPALLFHLPGISHLGGAVYRRIAAARPQNAACGIPVEPPFTPATSRATGGGTMPA